MRGRIIGVLAIAGLIAFCTGCGSVAQSNPDARIADLQDGRTTYAQVITDFGKPYQDYGEPDGSRTVVYILNQQQAGSATHVPMVGPYVGTIRQVQNKMTLQFDPSGVLTSHASQVTPAPPPGQ